MTPSFDGPLSPPRLCFLTKLDPTPAKASPADSQSKKDYEIGKKKYQVLLKKQETLLRGIFYHQA